MLLVLFIRGSGYIIFSLHLNRYTDQRNRKHTSHRNGLKYHDCIIQVTILSFYLVRSDLIYMMSAGYSITIYKYIVKNTCYLFLHNTIYLHNMLL